MFLLRRISCSSRSSSHKKALTPMISGCISGGLVGVAWIIGFIIYFYKRQRREYRARALGFRGHREMLDPPKKQEAFIIPPDPAIVEAGLVPGERVFEDPKAKGGPKHARTIPLTDYDTFGDVSPPPLHSSPPMPHWSSAPPRLPYSPAPPLSPSSSTSSAGHERLPLSPIMGRRRASEMAVPNVI